jgi:hypothetical protein
VLTSSSPSSRHFYLSLYLFFNNEFLKEVLKLDVTNPVRLLPFYCL